jgi:ectoine hydroxylase-related dioxygenase (phytanoyl-CoA dioxygenase family)
MPELQKRPVSAPTEEVLEIILRDGALILTDVISEQELDELNAELNPYMEATPVGRDDFTGRSTTRTGALVARSPKTRELVMNEAVLAAVGKFLEPYCHRFQLHLTQIIRLMPGQGKQAIHRDRWAWGKYMQNVEPQLNTIWALTDFTKENGATQVVPGSTDWPDDREAKPEEICQAVMPAGSLLLYTGSVFHAGGENCSNGDRVGLNITYSLGWLRQEENQFLSCPPEIARDLEPGLQDLLGYTQGSYALGYYTPPLPPGEGPEIVGPEHAVGREAGQLGEADAELLEALQNS